VAISIHKTVSVPIAAFLLSIGLSGCGKQSGPPLGYVEGVVTIDDEPASLVMVEFQPVQGGGSPSIGFADENGYYRLQFTNSRPGAVIGTHTIRVTMDDDPTPDNTAPLIDIPARYNKLSTLKAEVKPGKNRHDFNLTLSRG